MRKWRISLRAFEPDDIKRTHQWVNDNEVTRYTGTVYPVSAADNEAYWPQQLKNPNRATFAVDAEDGVHIGNVELRDIDWVSRFAETVVYIGNPEYRGKGYGNEMLGALFEFAFDRLNLHRLHSRVFGYNKAAMKMAEWCGYKKEGVMRQHLFRDGEFHDVIVYGALKEDYESALK